MKRLLSLLLLAVVAALIGYALVGWRGARSERTLARLHGDDLAWLQTEFHLDDERFAAIRAVHEAYLPICARHCSDIAAARARLADLRNNHGSASAIEEAEQALARLETVCNQATFAHVQSIAALMPDAAGERYLAMVVPRLAAAPHQPEARGGGLSH